MYYNTIFHKNLKITKNKFQVLCQVISIVKRAAENWKKFVFIKKTKKISMP